MPLWHNAFTSSVLQAQPLQPKPLALPPADMARCKIKAQMQFLVLSPPAIFTISCRTLLEPLFLMFGVQEAKPTIPREYQ